MKIRLKNCAKQQLHFFLIILNVGKPADRSRSNIHRKSAQNLAAENIDVASMTDA